jgi:hypothetical protein
MGRPRGPIRVNQTAKGFRVCFQAGGKAHVRTLPVASVEAAESEAARLQAVIDAGGPKPPSAIQGVESAPLRFWRLVNRSGPTPSHVPELGPCWGWIGAQTKDGYGSFSPNAKHRKGRRWRLAHRYSWLLATGAPPHMLVLHKCDNPLCVRPDHLFLGTDADNVADRARKKRHRGEERWNAKLTNAQAADIKAALRRGEPQSKLAREYGIHTTTIQQIASGRCWDHVPPAEKGIPRV